MEFAEYTAVGWSISSEPQLAELERIPTLDRRYLKAEVTVSRMIIDCKLIICCILGLKYIVVGNRGDGRPFVTIVQLGLDDPVFRIALWIIMSIIACGQHIACRNKVLLTVELDINIVRPTAPLGTPVVIHKFSAALIDAVTTRTIGDCVACNDRVGDDGVVHANGIAIRSDYFLPIENSSGQGNVVDRNCGSNDVEKCGEFDFIAPGIVSSFLMVPHFDGVMSMMIQTCQSVWINVGRNQMLFITIEANLPLGDVAI